MGNEDLVEILKLISNKLIEHEKLLTDLDSIIGDGDCGSGIKRGFEAVLNMLPLVSDSGSGEILKKTGFTLASTIGGTSGAVLGTGFMELGRAIGTIENLSLKDWATAAKSALDKIKIRGENTVVGDKTLVDALEPAVIKISEFAEKGNSDIREMLELAYSEAKKGSESTKDMVARKGRASYLGERTRGNVDPGSVVICLIFEAALDFFKK